ncbi:rRNA maturation RNase YbeY [bacterium]|nr:rRNA maturation RNase YbeY [bacterium]
MFGFCKCKVKLSFIYKNKAWFTSIKNLESLSRKVVCKTFKMVGVKQLNGMEINVLLTGDKEIQEFNKNYRGKNKPTNVLSFETGDELLLGDIVMSLATLKKEAVAQHISIEAHYVHLLCHGVLHLLGFDHIDDEEAREMEFFEIKILESMGISNPYE